MRSRTGPPRRVRRARRVRLAITTAGALLLLLTGCGGAAPRPVLAEAVPAPAVPPPPTRAAAKATLVAPGVTICIDPGHSLSDASIENTVTIDGREVTVVEGELNLDIATEVVARLRERFAGSDPVVRVIMTWGELDGLYRDWAALSGPLGDEEPLVQARGRWCVQQGAAAVFSLHINGGQPGANGTLTGFRDDDDRALADLVHGPILEALATGPGGGGVRPFLDYGIDPGDWWISEGADGIPAVILEPVMMTHDDEARRLAPSIAEAPAGRRAQIAQIEAEVIAGYIERLLGGGG